MIPGYGSARAENADERPNLAILLQFLTSMFAIACQTDAETAVAMEACMACDNFHGECRKTFPGCSLNTSVGSSEGSSILHPE